MNIYEERGITLAQIMWDELEKIAEVSKIASGLMKLRVAAKKFGPKIPMGYQAPKNIKPKVNFQIPNPKDPKNILGTSPLTSSTLNIPKGSLPKPKSIPSKTTGTALTTTPKKKPIPEYSPEMALQGQRPGPISGPGVLQGKSSGPGVLQRKSQLPAVSGESSFLGPLSTGKNTKLIDTVNADMVQKGIARFKAATPAQQKVLLTQFEAMHKAKPNVNSQALLDGIKGKGGGPPQRLLGTGAKSGSTKQITDQASSAARPTVQNVDKEVAFLSGTGGSRGGQLKRVVETYRNATPEMQKQMIAAAEQARQNSPRSRRFLDHIRKKVRSPASADFKPFQAIDGVTPSTPSTKLIEIVNNVKGLNPKQQERVLNRLNNQIKQGKGNEGQQRLRDQLQGSMNPKTPKNILGEGKPNQKVVDQSLPPNKTPPVNQTNPVNQTPQVNQTTQVNQKVVDPYVPVPKSSAPDRSIPSRVTGGPELTPFQQDTLRRTFPGQNYENIVRDVPMAERGVLFEALAAKGGPLKIPPGSTLSPNTINTLQQAQVLQPTGRGTGLLRDANGRAVARINPNTGVASPLSAQEAGAQKYADDFAALRKDNTRAAPSIAEGTTMEMRTIEQQYVNAGRGAESLQTLNYNGNRFLVDTQGNKIVGMVGEKGNVIGVSQAQSGGLQNRLDQAMKQNMPRPQGVNGLYSKEQLANMTPAQKRVVPISEGGTQISTLQEYRMLETKAQEADRFWRQSLEMRGKGAKTKSEIAALNEERLKLRSQLKDARQDFSSRLVSERTQQISGGGATTSTPESIESALKYLETNSIPWFKNAPLRGQGSGYLAEGGGGGFMGLGSSGTDSYLKKALIGAGIVGGGAMLLSSGQKEPETPYGVYG